MYKFAAIILILLEIVCNHTLAGSSSSNEKNANHKVIVSIKPLHSLVQGVMGETGKAELLVSSNISPHNFQLKPSHIKAIKDADAIFYIDDNFEIFLKNAFDTLPLNVSKIAVFRSEDLTLYNYRKGGVWEVHEHDREHHNGHDEHELSMVDMHIWLDADNAKKIVGKINRKLGEIYPENKKTYAENSAKLIERIDALDKKMKFRLSGLQDRPFIVFHDAYQYFERRYGLMGVGSITFEPNEPPSPFRIKQIRAKIKESKAVCVFGEPYYSDKLIRTVLEGSDVDTKTAILDPEATDLEAGEDLYFDMLENLSENIAECLESAN